MPDSGRILLDGRPLEEYRLADLRRRVVVVEHSPLLFRGSILDNLRYGHERVDEAAAIEAAQRAGVDEFVAALPEGYATQVGEGGAGFVHRPAATNRHRARRAGTAPHSHTG